MKILLLLITLQSAEDLYKAATADMDAQRWPEAAAKYELVLRDDPTHIPTQFNLAVCYAKTGNIDRAQQLYRKILEQDANIYEARINLAILLEQSGNLTGAAEEFEKAVTARSGDPEVRLAAGLLYMRTGAVDRAYEHLTTAERQGLKAPQLFIALSEAEHLRKDEVKSLAYLEQAHSLDPANKAVRRQLGIMYREAGNFSRAVEVLKDALPEARLELALAYYDNRQFADAAPLFAELAQADPTNVEYLFMFGKSMMEQMRYPEALTMLSRVLQMKPDHVEAQGLLGYLLYAQEDWPGAVQALTRFLEFQPRHAFSHFVLAICFDKLGNSNEALLHYNRFLEYDDGSSDARSFQARQRARILEERVRQ